MKNDTTILSNFEAVAHKDFWDDQITLCLRAIATDEKTQSKTRRYAVLKYEPIEPTHAMIKEKYKTRISVESAQSLMNQLWECGLRPSQAAGSAGQLAAVQYHLEDMRKIAGVNNDNKK
jgi:hypothetical protein